MSTEAVIAAEVIKALLMLAFREARRRNVSLEDIERISREVRARVEALDPEDIPEV